MASMKQRFYGLCVWRKLPCGCRTRTTSCGMRTAPFKPMCSITATPDDIVRHRPVSSDVVRSVNTKRNRFYSHDAHYCAGQIVEVITRPLYAGGCIKHCTSSACVSVRPFQRLMSRNQ